MKENHIRKVWKSEERKVKNIGKIMKKLEFMKCKKMDRTNYFTK